MSCPTGCLWGSPVQEPPALLGLHAIVCQGDRSLQNWWLAWRWTWALPDPLCYWNVLGKHWNGTHSCRALRGTLSPFSLRLRFRGFQKLMKVWWRPPLRGSPWTKRWETNSKEKLGDFMTSTGISVVRYSCLWFFSPFGWHGVSLTSSRAAGFRGVASHSIFRYTSWEIRPCSLALDKTAVTLLVAKIPSGKV